MTKLRDGYRARAERAEAALARVEALADSIADKATALWAGGSENARSAAVLTHVRDQIRAALAGPTDEPTDG